MWLRKNTEIREASAIKDTISEHYYVIGRLLDRLTVTQPDLISAGLLHFVTNMELTLRFADYPRELRRNPPSSWAEGCSAFVTEWNGTLA